MRRRDVNIYSRRFLLSFLRELSLIYKQGDKTVSFGDALRAGVLHRDREVSPTGGRAKRCPSTVGRGPSHATRACERVSLAMRLAGRPHHSCRSGSPDPDPFGIRRSRTTEVGARCAASPRFSIGIRSPRGDNYHNGVMKHPQRNSFVKGEFSCIRKN